MHSNVIGPDLPQREVGTYTYSMEDTLFCNKCKLDKPLDEFYPHLRKAENRENYWRYRRRCKGCSANDATKYRNHDIQRALRKRRQAQAQEFVWEYLKTHHCCGCGESNPLVLEFDHCRGNKEFEVSRLISASYPEEIAKEIEKCEVVCSNCHRIRTQQRANSWRYKRWSNEHTS